MSLFRTNGLRWSGGSSSRGGIVVIVDDKTFEGFARRGTSASDGPRLPALFERGTSARAGVVSSSSAKPDVPLRLSEIKRITGFSWDRVGAMLGCTRQTVYNWTQGEAVKPENARQVASLHEALKHIDRGGQVETVAVLESTVNGRSIMDMLTAGEHQAAMRLARKGSGRQTSGWTPMQAQKPSGRQDHWTDRVAAQAEDTVDDGSGFGPTVIVKKAKRRIK
jgi:hypothetical protein